MPLSAIAGAVGTPIYVYSAAAIRGRLPGARQRVRRLPARLHYALKANSTFALVRLLRGLGSAVDANSIWEIEVARRAGFEPADIVFTGVGKSDAELECAVALGLKAINVESAGELARVEAIAARLGVTARVAVRINPDIDAAQPPAHFDRAARSTSSACPPTPPASSPHRWPAGRRCGWSPSMCTSGRRSRRSNRCAVPRRFSPRPPAASPRPALQLEYLDAGGGLGIAYDDTPAVSAAEYVAALVAEIRPTGLPIVVEPGRSIVAPAAVLLARVVDLKPRDATSDVRGPRCRHDRTDAAGALQRLSPHRGGQAARRRRTALRAGRSGVREQRRGRPRSLLPRLEQGDLVAIRDAGAYGSAMASNYNRRPLPAEVLVDEGRWQVIRRRQTVDDMLALESE